MLAVTPTARSDGETTSSRLSVPTYTRRPPKFIVELPLPAMGKVCCELGVACDFSLGICRSRVGEADQSRSVRLQKCPQRPRRKEMREGEPPTRPPRSARPLQQQMCEGIRDTRLRSRAMLPVQPLTAPPSARSSCIVEALALFPRACTTPGAGGRTPWLDQARMQLCDGLPACFDPQHGRWRPWPQW